MKIAVDISQINYDNAGVNHYLRELLRAFNHRPEHEFVLVGRQMEDLGFMPAAHMHRVALPNIAKWRGGGFAWYWKLGRYLKAEQVDVLLEVTMNTAAIFFPRTLTVVLDMAPITNPAHSDAGTRRRYKFFLWLNQRFAWRLMALSETTKREFLKVYPKYAKEIAVTHAGLNAWVQHQPTAAEITAVMNKYKLQPGYLFSVSTLQPRKNYVGILQALAQLTEFPDLHYVIVGREGWQYEEIYSAVNDLGLSDRVHFLGPAPESELPALYSRARAFAFMSFDEGFGLTVIEAHACGLPVAMSDIPILRELNLAENVFYADPHDTGSMANAINLALAANKHYPQQEFITRFTWSNVGNNIIKALS